MTPTSLIIVTDRGTLKAYRVNATPTRGPSLQLVQAFDTTDAHGRYQEDRKSTRLNSSHLVISYAVFCLKKKNTLVNRARKDVQYVDLSTTNGSRVKLQLSLV